MGHTCSGGTSGCSCNSKFDGTFACLYSDKAFTSFKLAKMLAARKTYLLGMLRTSGRPKPTSMPLGEVDTAKRSSRSGSVGMHVEPTRSSRQAILTGS